MAGPRLRSIRDRARADVRSTPLNVFHTPISVYSLSLLVLTRRYSCICHNDRFSVTKNLKIEEGVATELGSNHIPFHILCKSHTCEKLDDSCINALVEIESELKYKSHGVKVDGITKAENGNKKWNTEMSY